jgi:glycosyltransferase involved in cell wall biosynthesis
MPEMNTPLPVDGPQRRSIVTPGAAPGPEAGRGAAVAGAVARRPLRVLHLLETLGRGGAERNLVNVLRHLPPGEHALCYLRPPDDYAAELAEAGIPVRCLGLHRPADLGRALYNLRQELLRGDFQLLFTQVFAADILGRLGGVLAGVPVLSAVQTSAYEPEAMATYRPLGRLKVRLFSQPLDALTARLCLKRLLAVSGFVRDRTVERLRVPPERVLVVPNSVDTDRFRPPTMRERAQARASLDLRPEERVLVTVGKLNRGKGNETLIDAMPGVLREHGAARLLVLGQGPDEAMLRSRAAFQQVAGAVRFCGQQADVLRYLWAADAFVFASRFEGLPLCVLEAMACELPCLLSKIPPHQEIAGPVDARAQAQPQVQIDAPDAEPDAEPDAKPDAKIDHGETAWLLPHDPAAWSAAISRLLRDPDAAAALSRAGRARVRRDYDARAVARALDAVFQTEAAKDPWASLSDHPGAFLRRLVLP